MGIAVTGDIDSQLPYQFRDEAADSLAVLSAPAGPKSR